MADAGSRRSASIAQAPRNGPAARNKKVQCQPTAALIGGTRWIDTIVSRKPTQVCTVTMVPTCSASDSSTTLAENCAESATTVIPQTAQKTTSSHGGLPNRKPASTAQLPLRSMAPMVSVVRPQRSAKMPPARQPIAPTPMVAKAASLAQNGAAIAGEETMQACSTKAAIHAHIA